MTQPAAPTITVVQDSREKRPLLFPAFIVFRGRRHPVKVETRPLDSGDYCLLDSAHLCLVERKGSLRELHNNLLSGDRHRASAALDRLSTASRHPVLLLEGSPADLLTPTAAHPDPGPLLQLFLDACAERHLSLLFVGPVALFPNRRRLVGELVLRILLAHME